VTESTERNVLTFTHHIDLIHLTNDLKISSAIKEALGSFGWHVSEHSFPFHEVQPKSTVLVVDELFSPVLSSIREDQWQAIKHFINIESKILWVTRGSQLEVANPDNALIHGLFRTIRAEDSSLSLTTLDVESSSSAETFTAIDCVLKTLKNPAPKTHRESEFVERHGVIHISRILPDVLINQAEKADIHGADLKIMSLHDCEPCVRFICERVGTLDSLCYAEMSSTEMPLDDDSVEVEIVAAGLNFKVPHEYSSVFNFILTFK
jgi:hypothetical protein